MGRITLQVRYPNASCSVCGKEFYRRPYEFKKWKTFCCRSCRSIVYKNDKSIWENYFKNGSGWNKGMSKANGDKLVYGKPRSEATKRLMSETRIKKYDIIGRKPIRSYQINSYYYRWRTSVLERDNYTCQWCGTKDNLQCHHIKRWMDYPELRYDIDNGLTLCFSCHKKTENYGTRKCIIIK